MAIKEIIRNTANERCIDNLRFNLGIIRSIYNSPTYIELKRTLSGLLPKFNLSKVQGTVDEIETTGQPCKKGDYYPEESFYRISIIYSGNLEDNSFFFRNSTVHYDKNMSFISVQHRYNQKEHNWREVSDQFESIFKNIQ